MDKRSFLKTASTLAGAAVLSPLLHCTPKKPEMDKISPLKNWAGNLEFSTQNIHTPETVDQAIDLVKKLPKLRILGSGHSFNTIADSSENLISTQKLNRLVHLDREQMTVTVEAGMKYGDLCLLLEKEGFALHNLASLPHISIAGSISTGTHGSGLENGNLSTAVSSIEMVNGKGELIQLQRDKDPEFKGAVVALGALGMITKLTLDVEPSYQMAQVVYSNLPTAALIENFETIMSAGYSVSLFTDWKTDHINQVWIKKKADTNGEVYFPENFFGALPSSSKVHPVESMSVEGCTEQLGLIGPWYERLPHFKMEFQPSAGEELQSEFFVPLENAYPAFKSIQEMADEISPHLFISEIRGIRADDLWLSPCFERNAIAIHTTWKQEIPEVMALLPRMEEKLSAFGARPHWAKLFTISPAEPESNYDKLKDFKNLIRQHDPEGKFQNNFIAKNIYQAN